MKTTRKYFGTDGIRGRVGNFPITVDFVLKLGWAVGTVLRTQTGGHAKVIIGKDTRISGYMIESALQAGLSAAGIDVYLLGPMPTSAIAYLTRTLRADIGIVISASHNNFDDNGIKFFSFEGYKLPDEMELAIEAQLEKEIVTETSVKLGKAKRIKDASGRYIEYCKSSVPHSATFKNYKIVVDCANGATYHVAPYILKELGADVITIHASPNGININEHCGSNHPEVIQHRVLKEKADLGIAFDGDGDRVVMVDHKGEIVDGDQILYIITKGLVVSRYFSGGVVGTLMSNKGLEVALTDMGIKFVRVPVGDQNVIRALLENHWMLGGEPSGHIMYLHVNTTDDGIIASLQVLQTMRIMEKSLHELKQGMKKFPQRIVNIKDNGQKVDMNDPQLLRILAEAETELGKNGRIVVRHSGTEPVIRIMVEAEDDKMIDKTIKKLQDQIEGMISTTHAE